MIGTSTWGISELYICRFVIHSTPVGSQRHSTLPANNMSLAAVMDPWANPSILELGIAQMTNPPINVRPVAAETSADWSTETFATSLWPIVRTLGWTQSISSRISTLAITISLMGTVMLDLVSRAHVVVRFVVIMSARNDLILIPKGSLCFDRVKHSVVPATRASAGFSNLLAWRETKSRMQAYFSTTSYFLRRRFLWSNSTRSLHFCMQYRLLNLVMFWEQWNLAGTEYGAFL